MSITDLHTYRATARGPLGPKNMLNIPAESLLTPRGWTGAQDRPGITGEADERWE